MKIKIHRGTHQIGGCVTEYEYNGWRLFVDFGEELPGGPKSGDLKIEGLTHGDLSKSALLITHYHGDHIGSVVDLPESLPIYMGGLGVKIQKLLSSRLSFRDERHAKLKERLDTFHTFKQYDVLDIGPFTVTPINIDHSAFDAYAFRIEADGVSAYHTGDFRTHGFRSRKTPELMKEHVGKVDYVVSEGTNVVRITKEAETESDLQKRFIERFKKNDANVVYLSSTNIDRLFSLYHASLDAKKPFLVDEYQKEVMDTIVNDGGLWNKSPLYQYGKYPPYDVSYNINPKLKKLIEDKGYVMIARVGPQFDKILDMLPGEKTKCLSMWDGYVDPTKKGVYNESLAKALGDKYETMHTSGHSDVKSMREVFRLLQPKAIIPIHTEKPEAFAKAFSDEWPILLLNDGDSISPISSKKTDSYSPYIYCFGIKNEDSEAIGSDSNETYWDIDQQCLGSFYYREDALSALSHAIYRPDAVLFKDVEEEEDSSFEYIQTYDNDMNPLSTYTEGGHRPGGDRFQEPCSFAPGDKVLAATFYSYNTIIPATIIGPVTPDAYRKVYEEDELCHIHFDLFEDFEKEISDFDWDAIVVRPLVRVDGMSEEVIVPRVYLFPYREVKI